MSRRRPLTPSPKSTVTLPSSCCSTLETLAPRWSVIPSRESASATASPTGSGSRGSSRGSPSISVTSLPKRWNACASSTPTGPPPSTMRLSGSSLNSVASRLVQRPSTSRRPSIGGMTGDEPVATTMLSVLVQAAAGRDAARPLDVALAADELDALLVEPLDRVLVLPVRGHEVAVLERRAEVDRPVHRLRGARHLARSLHGLARPQERLRRDARPVRALAADQLALDDRDAHATIRQFPGADLPDRTRSDDDCVVAISHAFPSCCHQLTRRGPGPDRRRRARGA